MTLPMAGVVACIYIGIPLALFTHDFSGRLFATVVASALVFAAAFGGVIRVLRMTTPAAASDHSEAHTPLELALFSSAAFAHRGDEPVEYRQMAEA
ncbi:MAG: hypothetical protein ABSD97_06855 [Acidimicrobiales bacterium]